MNKRRRAERPGLVCCGTRAVHALIASGRARCVWAEANNNRLHPLIELARSEGVEVKASTSAVLSSLSGGVLHQGLVAEGLPPRAEWNDLLSSPPPLLVVLDGVSDPRNLGAVMRAARAFGAGGVVCGERRSAPLSAAAAKAAGGAAAFMPLYRAGNLRRALEQLRDAGYFIAGASEHAEKSAVHADMPSPFCWVFGGEDTGLRRLTAESCDLLLRLPTVPGDGGCLNVSAAATAGLLLAATKNRLLE